MNQSYNNNEFQSYESYAPVQPVVSEQEVAQHTAKVMATMFVGLLVTVAASLLALYIPPIVQFVSLSTYGRWIVFGVQIALVLLLGSAVNSDAPAAVSTVAFLLYSISTGFTLAVFFIVFELWSLILSFAVTSILFLSLAIYGYVTKRDLSRMGPMLMCGLFTIIIGGVINWFIGSSSLDFIITIAGIIIFLGLIAFDTQKVKSNYASAIYNGSTPDSNKIKNLVIYGALHLYLDFINIFLYMVRIFGKRD